MSRGRVGIQRDPLSQEAILAELPKEGAGAVVVFYGHVRDDRTQRLRFEAYEEMASRELDRVRDEATAKFGLVGCVVRHRVGELGVGEAIVAVGVAAKHRREAFEAAAWAMDEIKTRVPIWKQEIAPDGSRRWVNDPTQG